MMRSHPIQDHLKTELKASLEKARVSILLYQRLEVLFRQTLVQSPASNYDYGHFEAPLDLEKLNSGQALVRAVDNSLEKWANRYPGSVYGFERIQVAANPRKRKSKSDYCRVIETLDLLSDLHPELVSLDVKERWIRDLGKNPTSSTADHSGKKEDENFAQLRPEHFDYLKCYLGFACGIFLPYFPDLESFSLFLVTKLSLEKGAPVHIDSVLDGDHLHLLLLAREPERLGIYKTGLTEALLSSGTGPDRTRIAS
jgi:hypothetical protein